MLNTKRKITHVITPGAADLHLTERELFSLYREALKRWLDNPYDSFTSAEPQGINVVVTNGDEQIKTWLVSDFPNLAETVYVIVDDYGEESDMGLVITVLLPDEY
jgi:hypothetical protein